jgi:glycosyltransferase involved in cell wall biosynthesis
MRPELQPPLVSVCIQTYQHAPFIRECLESVIDQVTNFPFEIIIGEDDSTDGTREFCLDFAGKYPDRVRLFLRSENDKIYIDGEKTGRYNFIENLKAARGKYIATLDGDDFWLDSDKLQKQADFMESHENCALSFHSTTEWQLHRESPERTNRVVVFKKFFSIEELMDVTGRLTLHTSNVMFRRNAIHFIPSWFYEVPFLDVALFAYTGSQGEVGYVPGLRSVYRIHKKGMWLSRPEPLNYIKQWKLFTVMSRNFEGELKEVLLMRRKKVCIDLIRFYRRHAWYNYKWFREELSLHEFPGDAELDFLLAQPPGLGDYFFNVGSYSKSLFRRLIKK